MLAACLYFDIYLQPKENNNNNSYFEIEYYHAALVNYKWIDESRQSRLQNWTKILGEKIEIKERGEESIEC